jgi:lipoate---protein ligase
MRCLFAGPSPIRRWTAATTTSKTTARQLSAASHPSSKVQFYLSDIRDPFVNLSVEDHLLRNTAADSTILFMYANDPCIVIGRNQNPWLEVNLGLLRSINQKARSQPQYLGNGQAGGIRLVRRRSGGGTVFHDGCNVNYSVICPPAAFDRDKHAEMVVRGLQNLAKAQGRQVETRVNERHDIVMRASGDQTTFKISGSAYKLTRLRSLHHGTCLLRSPNLKELSKLLRSPAEPYIKASGVSSVRSPVRNFEADNEEFVRAVKDEFMAMYGQPDVDETVGKGAANLKGVSQGISELRRTDWRFGQTPRFTFSTKATNDADREESALPESLSQLDLCFGTRQGVITEFRVDGVDLTALVGKTLHRLPGWETTLQQGGLSLDDGIRIGRWLEDIMGNASETDPEPAWGECAQKARDGAF